MNIVELKLMAKGVVAEGAEEASKEGTVEVDAEYLSHLKRVAELAAQL